MFTGRIQACCFSYICSYHGLGYPVPSGKVRRQLGCAMNAFARMALFHTMYAAYSRLVPFVLHLFQQNHTFGTFHVFVGALAGWRAFWNEVGQADMHVYCSVLWASVQLFPASIIEFADHVLYLEEPILLSLSHAVALQRGITCTPQICFGFCSRERTTSSERTLCQGCAMLSFA